MIVNNNFQALDLVASASLIPIIFSESLLSDMESDVGLRLKIQPFESDWQENQPECSLHILK